MTDFRLWFRTGILHFGHNLDIRLLFLDSRFCTDIRSTSDFGHNSDSFWTDIEHQTSDFVRLCTSCTSDFKLWTLDISFQTSDCGLRTYFRRRIVAFIVRHRTYVKLQTQDSDNLFVTQQKQTYICNQISSRNTL